MYTVGVKRTNEAPRPWVSAVRRIPKRRAVIRREPVVSLLLFLLLGLPCSCTRSLPGDGSDSGGAALDGSPTDSGGAGPGSASMADLSGPAFCAGTRVAGTCAQQFFASLARCFVATGPCVVMGTDLPEAWCWSTGARLEARIDAMTGKVAIRYLAAAGVCADGGYALTGAGVAYTLSANGRTIVYDESTGAVVCPPSPRASPCAAVVRSARSWASS